MASKQVATASVTAWKRFVHQSSKYCRFGLYHDDMLEEYPHIKEAISRIPADVRDERNFRLFRAIHLDLQKVYLPKEEWITAEEDREKGRYLQPYINEVLEEIKEKEEWEKR